MPDHQEDETVDAGKTHDQNQGTRKNRKEISLNVVFFICILM